MKRHSIEQYIFLALLLALFGWTAWGSLDFPEQAQTFPWMVSAAALVLIIIEAITYGISIGRGTDEGSDSNSISQKIGGILPYLAWLGGYYVAIYLVGMVFASGLFVFLFLLLPGKMKWYYALLSAVLVITFLITMEDVMSLRWPDSLIDPIEMLGLH